MHSRTISNNLTFKIQAIIEKTEVWTLINGEQYIYRIDGALIPSFRGIYFRSPAKALNFLKKHSYYTEKTNDV